MVRILREADAAPVAEIARKHGIAEQTLYAWRKRYGVLDTTDIKRLRVVEYSEPCRPLIPTHADRVIPMHAGHPLTRDFEAG